MRDEQSIRRKISEYEEFVRLLEAGEASFGESDDREVEELEIKIAELRWALGED